MGIHDLFNQSEFFVLYTMFKYENKCKENLLDGMKPL